MRVIDAALVIFRIDILPDSVLVFYPERDCDLLRRAAVLPVFCPESIFVCVARLVHKGIVRNLVVNLDRSVLRIRLIAIIFVHCLAEYRIRTVSLNYFCLRKRNHDATYDRFGIRPIMNILFVVVLLHQAGKIYPAEFQTSDRKIAVNVYVTLHANQIIDRADDKVAVGVNTARHAFQNKRVEQTRLHHAFTVFRFKTVD